MPSKSSTSSSTSKPDGKRPMDLSDLSRADRNYLLYWCMRLTKHREDAEDLMQITLLRALSAKFEGKCSRRSWLCLIARTQFLIILRSRKSRVNLSEAIEIDELADYGIPKSARTQQLENNDEPLLDRMLRIERETAIRQIIAAQPPAYRKSLEAIYFADQNYKEAAKLLNISIGAVKSNTHKAKGRIRHRLQPFAETR